jgi:hypothetical protein
MAEPPYGIIANNFKKGLIVPFLGAGTSLSGRPQGAQWNQEATFLPLGGELSRFLADDVGYPSQDNAERSDLSKVASYYTISSDRMSLVSFIHDVFNRDYQIGAIHRLLADLPTPTLIVTTNYDDLVERAFKEKGRPFHLVAYPTDHKELAASILWWKPGATEPESFPPAKLPLSLTDTSIIYKMHGTVDRMVSKWDGYVITEEDYIDFLSRMTAQTAIPARFMLEFRKRRFLFLGYGMRDWNLRVMLRNIKGGGGVDIDADGEPDEEQESSGDNSAWAIQYKPSELEQKLWGSRKVNIYDVDIDTFVSKVRARTGL